MSPTSEKLPFHLPSKTVSPLAGRESVVQMVYPQPAWAVSISQSTSDGVAASRQRRAHAFAKTSRFGDDDEPPAIGAPAPRHPHQSPLLSFAQTPHLAPRPAAGAKPIPNLSRPRYRAGSNAFPGRDARPYFGRLGLVGDGPQAIFYGTETVPRTPTKKGKTLGPTDVGPFNYDTSNAKIVRNLSTAPRQPHWTMYAAERGLERPISRPASAAPSSSRAGGQAAELYVLPGAVGKQQSSKMATSPSWTMADEGAGRHTTGHLLELTSGLVGFTMDKVLATRSGGGGVGGGTWDHIASREPQPTPRLRPPQPTPPAA